MSRVAHPLIAPMPALASPVRVVARQLALRGLRRLWRGVDGAVELELPDGTVERVGQGPGVRVRVHDDRLFLRLLWRGEMGAGEAFVAGEWDTDDLVGVIRRFARASGGHGFESPLTWVGRLPELWRHRRAANVKAQSSRNIQAHYDLGNDFYRLFLDETMTYSSGLYARPDLSLAQAQRAKFDRICQLAELRPGERVLEIGCGWGGMAIHLARRGCLVHGVTVSPAQLAGAEAAVAAAGVADRVSLALCDYRDLDGQFDKVVSIEMLEAVGAEFLPTYFAQLGRRLRRGGRAVIQSITMPDDRFDAYRDNVDWMQANIFPGAAIPSLGAIRAAVVGSGLALVGEDDIGVDYPPTLRAWRQRFVDGLDQVRALGYDEPFIRTWLLYLAFSEASFAERTLRNHHLVFEAA